MKPFDAIFLEDRWSGLVVGVSVTRSGLFVVSCLCDFVLRERVSARASRVASTAKKFGVLIINERTLLDSHSHSLLMGLHVGMDLGRLGPYAEPPPDTTFPAPPPNSTDPLASIALMSDAGSTPSRAQVLSSISPAIRFGFGSGIGLRLKG